MDSEQGGNRTARKLLRIEIGSHDFQRPMCLRTIAVQHYIDSAWALRGSGMAATVTEDGWKGFHTNLMEAKRLLEPAVNSGDLVNV